MMIPADKAKETLIGSLKAKSNFLLDLRLSKVHFTTKILQQNSSMLVTSHSESVSKCVY